MNEANELRTRVGQRVALDPSIYPADAGRAFTVEKAEFAKSKTGVILGTFLTLKGRRGPVRDTETLPAPAESRSKQEKHMASTNPTDRILNCATDLRTKDPNLGYTASVLKAGDVLGPKVVTEYQESFRGDEAAPSATDAASRPALHNLAMQVQGAMARDPKLTVESAAELVIAGRMATPIAGAASFSATAKTGESFDDLAMRLAAEKGISLRDAVHQVGLSHPHLAAAR